MMAALFIDARNSIEVVSPNHSYYGWEVTLEAADLIKQYGEFQMGICDHCGMRAPLEYSHCAWGCE